MGMKVGLAAGLPFALFVLFATLVLGHVRLVWMEFATVLPAGIVGFVCGFACGAIWGSVRKLS